MPGYQSTRTKHCSRSFPRVDFLLTCGHSDVELDLRRLLHYYTSWTATDEQGELLFAIDCHILINYLRTAVLVARVLTQALSNMITGNDPLMTKLWNIYMNLSEDQVVLMSVSSPMCHTSLFNCSRARTDVYWHPQIAVLYWLC